MVRRPSLTGAVFVVPGTLTAPTGGYAYARRLLAELDGVGRMRLSHWPVPDVPPRPSGETIAELETRLSVLPDGWPILFDGLALGALPAELIRRLPGPVVALCHHPLALETGLGPEDAEWLARNERAALAVAAAVVTTSEATARILAADYGVDRDRITVARPGTDRVPAASGSGGGEVAVLSVGGLTPRKGHDVLIAALAGLPARTWRLTIAGPGATETGHGAALAGLASELGVADRVRFAGAVSERSLAELYRSADLFVLASRYEGYGMAFTEAMAHGLPVVGSDIGAVAEATLGAAHLVPPGDEVALGAALGPLVGDPEARRALAGRCRDAALRLPRWPDTAETVAEVLRSVAATARRTPA